MKHLGDITQIDGATAPVVDCIIGGSPCQDLSIAGKRAGLAGERSGLYMEQIRIIKEMRANYRRFQGRKERDPKTRAKTFQGIAEAFADQWGSLSPTVENGI